MERVSVIGAFRATERDREGFAAALGGLRDERLVRLREVPGLTRSEAARLVSARARALPSSAFTQALYEETEGNPFFIEEIVRHLADSGVEAATAGAHELHAIGLPDDVQEVITRRLARLGDDALETLRVAAVIGREFDAGLLERVLDLDEERFFAALEEAQRAGLIAEQPSVPEGYAFAHALVRETLYGGDVDGTARTAAPPRRAGAGGD